MVNIAHLLLEILYAAAAMADTRALLSKEYTSMLKSQVSTPTVYCSFVLT